jgi:hypothetical protein
MVGIFKAYDIHDLSIILDAFFVENQEKKFNV